MPREVLYADSLVVIDTESIRLRWYYFPFGSKHVYFSQIQEIITLEPTLVSGKWRIWGTGGFTTWFPCDWGRPWRDTIFLMTLRTQTVKIGFTVKDSRRVHQLLKDKGLID